MTRRVSFLLQQLTDDLIAALRYAQCARRQQSTGNPLDMTTAALRAKEHATEARKQAGTLFAELHEEHRRLGSQTRSIRWDKGRSGEPSGEPQKRRRTRQR